MADGLLQRTNSVHFATAANRLRGLRAAIDFGAI